MKTRFLHDHRGLRLNKDETHAIVDEADRLAAILHLDSAYKVVGCASALLTALNVGDIHSGSPLHLHLRKIIMEHREKTSKILY